MPTRSLPFHWPNRAKGWALLLFLPLVAGCGPRLAQVKVSGQVLLDGAALPGGRLTFRPADPAANSVTADLDEQGHYEIVLIEGNVQVSVDNRELAPRPPQSGGGGIIPPNLPPEVRSKLGGGVPRPPPVESAPKASSRYKPIPPKYYAAETSGLEFTVKRGDEKHDFELKTGS